VSLPYKLSKVLGPQGCLSAFFLLTRQPFTKC